MTRIPYTSIESMILTWFTPALQVVAPVYDHLTAAPADANRFIRVRIQWLKYNWSLVGMHYGVATRLYVTGYERVRSSLDEQIYTALESAMDEGPGEMLGLRYVVPKLHPPGGEMSDGQFFMYQFFNDLKVHGQTEVTLV